MNRQNDKAVDMLSVVVNALVLLIIVTRLGHYLDGD